jgi:hypothetical protein
VAERTKATVLKAVSAVGRGADLRRPNGLVEGGQPSPVGELAWMSAQEADHSDGRPLTAP